MRSQTPRRWPRRCALFFTIATALVACEGTTLRCDPTASWSYARPDGGSDAQIVLPTCEPGACPIAELESGARHTCARAWSGAVICWGSNDRGQSDPTRLDETSLRPTRVFERSDPAGDDLGLALGAGHTCVADGEEVACWGEPRVVGGSAGERVRLSVGSEHGGLRAGAAHTCTHVPERASDGSIVGLEPRCFGAWDGRELGNVLGELRPVDEGALLDARGFVTCDQLALEGGRLSCWGGAPPGGRLVPGPWLGAEELAVETPVVSWALGAEHLCVQSGITLRCRGRGDRGQLGDGRSVSSDDFVAVRGLPPRPIVSMCIGGQGALQVDAAGAIAAPPNGGFTCAIALQSIWCWGANHRGQLGDGTLTDRATPVRVRRVGVTAQHLACGEAHACVRTPGAVWCWGDNSHGQLGRPARELPHSSVPIEVDLVP